jgi:hypothetical protein
MTSIVKCKCGDGMFDVPTVSAWVCPGCHRAASYDMLRAILGGFRFSFN